MLFKEFLDLFIPSRVGVLPQVVVCFLDDTAPGILPFLLPDLGYDEFFQLDAFPEMVIDDFSGACREDLLVDLVDLIPVAFT